MEMDEQAPAPNAFLQAINKIRDDARAVMQGPAPQWLMRRKVDVALLQSVLDAEIACVLRYTMISVSETGLRHAAIGAEFQEQANDERRHMSLAAARIEELGGTPDFSAETAFRAAVKRDVVKDFSVHIRENLEAEQSVIEHYRELIRFFGTRDAETCRLLEDIVRDEEDHTSDIEDLLASYRN
jgi:bacterioferritin